MHLLHSLFSVPVDVHSTTRRLFACRGELPGAGLPLVLELPSEAFAVRRSMRAVSREDHISHLGGVSPPDWQTKLLTGSRDLACRGLTFVSPYCATWVLGRE